MPNELDILMSRLTAADFDEALNKDPLLQTPRDIDVIIAYQRKARANNEAGIKTPKAKKEAGPSVAINLESLGLSKPKPQASMKRRV